MGFRKEKLAALLLASALTWSLAGCHGTATQETTQGTTQEITQGTETPEDVETKETTQPADDVKVKAEAKAGSDGKMTPWLNANVAGTVTEDTTAELKDDFNLAVNYDYLKDTEIGEGRSGENSFEELQDMVNKRLIKMMTDETIEGHDASLLRELYAMLLGKAGYEEKEAEEIIDNAYAFEEALAPAIMSTAESYAADAMERMLNKVTMEELAEMSPNDPIAEIIKAAGLGNSERINLNEPEWLSKINEVYTEENLEKIKSYILVHTLLDFGDVLDEETFRELMRISNETSGITGSKADEELALSTVQIFLQTSLSKVYVSEYVSAEMRDDVTNIIKESIGAYRTMLASEEWLSDETKEKALEKLDYITINAAYPDKWEDTDGLKITPKEDGGSYFNALTEIARYRMELQKTKVNTKIDREAWATDMPLTIVNAFYNPTDNSINIIAGILGGSFYNSDMTEEEKLAGIGVVIGHEISHAFDTTGAQFDKDGNFASWWTDEDYNAFGERAQKLIDYYDTIVPFDGGENYPGSNVQGEAIADMAGVKCMLLLAEEEEDFDYDAFFRAYASLWKGIYSREYCEQSAYQDSHPIDYLRVNVALMQQPEFYETYDIKEGDGMYMAEEDRIAVW